MADWQVVSAHPDLRIRILEALERGRLVPPAPLTISVVVGPLPPAPDARSPFVQPAFEVRAGPPDHSVVITGTTVPARATIAPGCRQADVELAAADDSSIEDFVALFLPVVVTFLLRPEGWHHVHAAGLRDPTGRGWVLAGNAHAGKSTTTALLATRGWAVCTDDLAFLHRGSDGRVRLAGWHGDIALRNGGRDLLQRTDGTPLPRRGKTGWTPEALGGEWVAEITPDVVAFPTVGDGPTRVCPISSLDALKALIRWSALVTTDPRLAENHLALLTALARQAQSCTVQLGNDLFEPTFRLEDCLP